ncbi:MAG: squalene/phytoene synthase family protein [Gammaproteobacteria bacterium]
MNPRSADEYCRNKAAPPGSSFYYSTLFLPEPLRRDLHALHALGTELEGVLEECSDPGVMHMKLSWWQDEITRLYQHAARHPVSHALENVVSRHGIQETQLLQVINNYAQLIPMPQPQSLEELVLQFSGGTGMVWRLAAEICGHQAPETPTLAAATGCLISCFQLLQRTAPPDAVNQIRGIQEQLEHHGDIFPEADRHRQLHVLVMGQIISRTCREILRGDETRGRRLALSPLRKLWIAWRLHRRYRNT